MTYNVFGGTLNPTLLLLYNSDPFTFRPVRSILVCDHNSIFRANITFEFLLCLPLIHYASELFRFNKEKLLLTEI